MPPSQLFAIAWIGWIFTWAAASFWSGRTEKRLATGEVWAYRLSSLVGLILLSHFTARALGLRRMWHVGYNGAYLLALLTFGGIFFAWWARIHLGRLWSGSITRKEGHHVVDTGPYGLVRHPIYTGLLLAIMGTALIVAEFRALLAFAIVLAAFYLKARKEEAWLAREFGETFEGHAKQTGMFLPRFS